MFWKYWHSLDLNSLSCILYNMLSKILMNGILFFIFLDHFRCLLPTPADKNAIFFSVIKCAWLTVNKQLSKPMDQIVQLLKI